jgi:type II secretory pathway pseudopilin PulG
MAIHFRPTPVLAMIGVLALGGASVARAQDTSAAVRADTSGYQPYQNRTDSTQLGKDSTRTDSSGFKYNGPPTDTTLKAEPGAQTGPSKDSTGASKDSGSTSAPSALSSADSVGCKDGSNEGNRGGVSCGGHGGIDSVSTTAAMKARGWLGKSDSSAAKDTSSPSQKQSP